MVSDRPAPLPGPGNAFVWYQLPRCERRCLLQEGSLVWGQGLRSRMALPPDCPKGLLRL